MGPGGGRFYEVDAALVCDELAGFLVNLTRDLSFSLSCLLARSLPFSTTPLHSALLFYNLPRANGTAYTSYFFITSNDPRLLLFPLFLSPVLFLLRLLIANESREINRSGHACLSRVVLEMNDVAE